MIEGGKAVVVRDVNKGTVDIIETTF